MANAWAGSQLPVITTNHTIIVINLLSAVIQLPKANSLSNCNKVFHVKFK